MKIASLIICIGIALLTSCGMSPEEKKAKAEELRVESEKLNQELFAEGMLNVMRGVDVKDAPDFNTKADKLREIFDEINELDPTMRERFEQLDKYLKNEKGL